MLHLLSLRLKACCVKLSGKKLFLKEPSRVSVFWTLNDLKNMFKHTSVPFIFGATWTTDAPFRETEMAIAYYHSAGILGVEMEVVALYAFSEAMGKDVICFAQITNQMGTIENDFEKGVTGGNLDALQVTVQAAKCWAEHNIVMNFGAAN